MQASVEVCSVKVASVKASAEAFVGIASVEASVEAFMDVCVEVDQRKFF